MGWTAKNDRITKLYDKTQYNIMSKLRFEPVYTRPCSEVVIADPWGRHFES